MAGVGEKRHSTGEAGTALRGSQPHEGRDGPSGPPGQENGTPQGNSLKDEDSKPDTSLLWSASQQEIFRGTELPKRLTSGMPALKDFWIATFLLVSVR